MLNATQSSWEDEHAPPKKKNILLEDIFLDGGFKYLLCSPLPGEDPILTNIFQMGWNHQPDFVGRHFCVLIV